MSMSNRTRGLGRALALLWRTIVRDLFDSYRPELHYMRGPGPRWHEKHGRPAAGSVAGLTEAPV
jgi:hypothetical protein